MAALIDFAPTFLVGRLVYVALVIIVLITLTSLVLNLRLWQSDRLSAWLLLPCTFYLLYTAVLTYAVIAANPVLPPV